MRRIGSQLFQVRTEDVELQIGIASAATDVGNPLDPGAHVGKVSQDLPGLAHDIELRPAAGMAQEFGNQAPELGQTAVDVGESDIALAFADAAGSFANGDQRVSHGLLVIDFDSLEPMLDLRADFRGARERGAFGRLERNFKFAGVVLGQKGEFGERGQQRERQ